MTEIKGRAVKGVVWSAVERFAIQGIQFIVMLVMARLLLPEDYGLLGMASIFMSLATSMIDSGFSQALIRKQDRTNVDYSTVFFFNIVISIFIYFICYLLAPFVAEFYNVQELEQILQVLCIIMVVNSLAVVPRAIYTVNLDFKTQAMASLVASIISGIVGITMAYSGYGVWSLVNQQIVFAVVSTLLLLFMSKWRPILVFSSTSFRSLFSFGSKLLISGLIDTIYKEVYTIIVGKLFSATSLGHYSRAKHFSDFPSSNLTGIMQRVTYPILCEMQNDDERLRSVYRRFLKMSAFIVFPLMIGMASVSKSFVHVVIGDQWDSCSQLLQIICFAMMWYPVHAINLNLLQVKGRSDLFLKLEIIKNGINIVVILVTAPYGLLIMCYGQIVNSIISLIINTYYTGKLINLGFLKQMYDLLPTIGISMIMFFVVFFLQRLFDSYLTQLIIGSFVGAIVFVLLAIFLRFSELWDIKDILIKRT